MIHCQKLEQQPDLLALHQLKPDCYPYLLASNTEGQVNTRFSILMAYPDFSKIQRKGETDILDNIDVPLTPEPKILPNLEYSDLPFLGGWFVYLSYEYAQFIEAGVHFHGVETSQPIALISRVPASIIIDHDKNTSYIISEENRPELVEAINDDLSVNHKLDLQQIPQSEVEEENSNIYRDYLKKTREYIFEGDIFQANLSRKWTVNFINKCDPVSLYHQLKQHNPAPFAALIKLGETYLLSSSPERLVSVKNSKVETRPIAGTHPRGKSMEEDALLSKRLLAHPKERAEHIMLIDLERNDLGRLCVPGSINVSDNMSLETYQHVHHIVSSVHGTLKSGLKFKDIIHAVFPGGTITGCPKVRCMEIISELENTARGAYTGSIGYISNHGVMDMNILIRTMIYANTSVQFRAGAGIVIDSETEKELSETRHKARGLLNAIQPH